MDGYFFDKAENYGCFVDSHSTSGHLVRFMFYTLSFQLSLDYGRDSIYLEKRYVYKVGKEINMTKLKLLGANWNGAHMTNLSDSCNTCLMIICNRRHNATFARAYTLLVTLTYTQFQIVSFGLHSVHPIQKT